MNRSERMPAIALCFLLPLLALGCATGAVVVKADDPLFGTWINEEYGGVSKSSPQKCVIFSAGRELDYKTMSDAQPEWEGRFTIEKAWVDEEGNHWYKTRWTGNYFPYRIEESWKGFGLTRINNSGTIMESVSAEAGYPEELSVLGGAYGIYYRQE
jgi:hypothetical protein